MPYFESETIEKKDFRIVPFEKGQYEECVFVVCNFSEVDLSSTTFIDCKFIDCNLSMANIHSTAFQSVEFINCKMIGAVFADCNPFNFSVFFKSCQLNNSSFYGLKMKKTIFDQSSLHEVDFVNADLSDSKFIDCELDGAMFENTNLQNADLKSAENFSIDPEQNNIKRAKFSLENLSGLLRKYDIDIEY